MEQEPKEKIELTSYLVDENKEMKNSGDSQVWQQRDHLQEVIDSIISCECKLILNNNKID